VVDPPARRSPRVLIRQRVRQVLLVLIGAPGLPAPRLLVGAPTQRQVPAPMAKQAVRAVQAAPGVVCAPLLNRLARLLSAARFK
jgi:hypothetical protein